MRVTQVAYHPVNINPMQLEGWSMSTFLVHQKWSLYVGPTAVPVTR